MNFSNKSESVEYRILSLKNKRRPFPLYNLNWSFSNSCSSTICEKQDFFSHSPWEVAAQVYRKRQLCPPELCQNDVATNIIHLSSARLIRTNTTCSLCVAARTSLWEFRWNIETFPRNHLTESSCKVYSPQSKLCSDGIAPLSPQRRNTPINLPAL